MVRPYRAREYRAQLDAIRARVSDACLGTDVIVGFPGETDDDFRETLDFIAGAGIDYVHVFSYSDREGTASTRLGGKVDPRVIKERSTALHALAERLWHRHLDRQLDRVLPALMLDGELALTENYCQVRVAEGGAPNHPCRIHITAREDHQLTGQLA